MSFLVAESPKCLLEYSRKSRADNPTESVEEVLAKHESIMQEFCLREYNFTIPQENIYKEVVSGESIDERIEIKKVLARCEEPEIKGIVVVEPQRLSRGDLIDCGRLIDTLRYSNTMVITPMMTYDLNNKMERKFFQDELLRGRDYLEYVKEILMRGKLASINRGCFIQSHAPFGYDRIKIGNDFTLVPNDDAEVVKMIFDMYVNGTSTWHIARHLESLGIKTPLGKDEWHNATLDKMIKNQHYVGKIVYQKTTKKIIMEDGEKTAKRVYQDDGDYLCIEGKHQPIIDKDVFDKAQEIIHRRPPVKKDLMLKNAFAGMLYCERCGKNMTYKKNSEERQYVCCGTTGCSKSVKYPILEETVIQTLEQIELPELIAKSNNNEGNSLIVQKNLLSKLEKELASLKEQEETQYELLETKQYTKEIFAKRNKALREKMQNCEKQITDVKKNMPKPINYTEKAESLKTAIASLRNPDIPIYDKNQLLRAIVERIDCFSAPNQEKGKFEFSLKITLKI